MSPTDDSWDQPPPEDEEAGFGDVLNGFSFDSARKRKRNKRAEQQPNRHERTGGGEPAARHEQPQREAAPQYEPPATFDQPAGAFGQTGYEQPVFEERQSYEAAQYEQQQAAYEQQQQQVAYERQQQYEAQLYAEQQKRYAAEQQQQYDTGQFEKPGYDPYGRDRLYADRGLEQQQREAANAAAYQQQAWEQAQQAPHPTVPPAAGFEVSAVERSRPDRPRPQSSTHPSIPLPTYDASIDDPSELNDDEAPARVRAYAWTRGRTQSQYKLEIETLLTTSGQYQEDNEWIQAEYHSIAALCHQPRSVAEVSALLSLPLGVAKVLLGDMAAAGLLVVHETASTDGQGPDLALMERILSGLRRL